MRRAIAAAVIACCGACGRLDFEISARDAAAHDTPVDACTSFSAFGSPRFITELNSPATDYGGQVSADGLTYYFDSDRTGDDDIYAAHRASRTGLFDEPARIVELESTDRDSDPTVTADELEMFFHSNRNAMDCLYTAHRETTDAPWSSPIALTDLCTGGISGPFISGNGLTLVYNTLDDGVGEGKLMIAHRTSRAQMFATGALIDELLDGHTKGYPAMSSDGLTLYYESTGGGTHLQVWQTTRATADAPFGTAVLVPGVDDNDVSNEGDISLTADGLDMFFASDKASTNDIYVSSRTCQ